MLKLYGGARSRASIVQWYLEELGVPYEFVLLDMSVGAHREPEFLAINPIGKVPAIADGDTAVFDSNAILLHLAEKKVSLPSPALGHGEGVAEIDRCLAGTRLAVTGNYFEGLAIEDCVLRSYAEWRRVAAR